MLGREKENASPSRPAEAPCASEDKYRLMVEHAGQAIIVAQDGWLKFVNPKAAEAVGYTQEELLSVPFLEFIYPEDRARVVEGYRRRISGEDPDASYCFRVIDRAGNVKWLELSGVRIEWDGKPATLNYLTDVTARMEAELALRESESRFRTLVEHSFVGVCIIQDGRLTYANDRLAEIFACSKAEASGELETWLKSFVHAEDRESLRQLINEVLMGKVVSARIEFRGIRRNEEMIHVQAYAARVIVSQGPAAMITFLDVTAERCALEALRASEERFQMMMATIRDTLYRLRFADRKYDYMSPAVKQLTGYTPEEIAEIGFKSLILRMEVIGSDATDLTEIAQRMHSGELREWRALYQILDREGNVKWVRDHAFPWRDENGRVVGTVGILEDVTELHQAEEALRESERRFRDLFENAPVGYHDLDTDGRITRINRTELQLLGYTREEMLGQPYWQFSADPPQCEEFFLEMLKAKGRQTRAREIQLRKKDGSLLPVLLECRLLRDRTGRVVGLRSTVQDLTPLKKLQEQLMLAQRLETVGVLAGGVAHDFNNLLTVILGSVQLMLASLPEGHPLRRDLLEIQKAAERGAALTRQLLAFARKQIMRPQAVVLNDVVRGLEPMLRRLIGEDIRLELQLQEPLAPVFVDPAQFEQVIMNLAVNARDAMPQGGVLRIETREVYLDEDYAQAHPPTRPGRYVELVVSDTGIGMDDETLKHIFEPFFTTKEVGKGTGLGLSTVYGIVKQSDGYIWVYSEPGVGSAFKIYLPAQPSVPADEADPETAIPARRARGKTLLLVEDDERVRQVTSRALARFGFRVLSAANAQQALDIARDPAQRIDLVVCDVIMPGMNGPDLVDRLSEVRPGVRVVFMSGYPASTLESRTKLAGRPLIQKPFDLEELGRILLELVDQSSSAAAT